MHPKTSILSNNYLSLLIPTESIQQEKQGRDSKNSQTLLKTFAQTLKSGQKHAEN